MKRALHFYRDILGAELVREYGGTSAVFQFLTHWILLVTPGGPTEDKPDTEFSLIEDSNKVSHSFTIRVKDCESTYQILKSRGAEFITPTI